MAGRRTLVDNVRVDFDVAPSVRGKSPEALHVRVTGYAGGVRA
jgi:hypothetical protein